MLRQVAGGVLIHQSEFRQSNAVVVQGRADVLLIDPGILGYEMATSRRTFASWVSPLWQGFLRIRIGITCSGTSRPSSWAVYAK
jgi:hypothetical protein